MYVICVCRYAHLCTHGQYQVSLPSLLHLTFWERPLTESTALQSAESGWPVSSRGPLVSVPKLGATGMHSLSLCLYMDVGGYVCPASSLPNETSSQCSLIFLHVQNISLKNTSNITLHWDIEPQVQVEVKMLQLHHPECLQTTSIHLIISF